MIALCRRGSNYLIDWGLLFEIKSNQIEGDCNLCPRIKIQISILFLFLLLLFVRGLSLSITVVVVVVLDREFVWVLIADHKVFDRIYFCFFPFFSKR